MSLPVQSAVLVLSVVGLGLGARALVDSVVRLARRVGLSELTIGLTVVAVGTSTPELVVTLDAAFGGAGGIAVGNVVGSNIYNLAFVLGVVSLVRVVPVDRSLLHRDGVLLLASTLVGAVVLLDLTVSRVEGALLVALFVAYTAFLLWDSRRGGAASDGGKTAEDPLVTDLTERVTFRGRDAALLAGGLAVVLVSGHFMVESASAIARIAGLSEALVGGTIVAAGTSTPELAVSLVAVRRGSLGVSVGNVVGSNVFNFLAVLGLGALVRPLTTGPGTLENVAWLVGVVGVTVVALWSGRKLSRAEGGLFAASEVARWALGLLGLVG
ncbi:calcium/sodium antiporter [Salinirubellus salinus]|jgi:cation:H+ antiporter|uniref:Calcium/sodium antiporter n=1 Tax=Salinirubellus salinus TaxID=1364945 RepID=A0A9E7R7N2_9EURY|nr:calcium/sodium antiporter [Salinirubellus salinus]UWM56743.1 calcium/sodium antiporter [Salinirubellus salinus]